MPAKTRASKRSRDRAKSPPRGAAKRLPGNPFAALLETVRKEVDSRLAGLFDAKIDAAASRGPEVVDMVEAVRDLCLRGGKRLRAALVVAGYRAASGSADLEAALDAAVAIELLHAYFLIHDDWMDDDAVRRGGPTVHTVLAERYGSKRLGNSCAILAGDYSLALATEALARVDVPPERLPRAFAAFAEMQSDAIAGQQRDVLARSPDAEMTYLLKTGSYTVAGPLRMGAILAGGSESLATAFDRFAIPAGIAFQIRDDLLSAFGDESVTGKPFANDIKMGKRTLVVEHAFRLAKGRELAALRKAFGNARASRKDLEAAVRVLQRSGAEKAAEDRTLELARKAEEAILDMKVAKTGRALLSGALDALLERRS
ncbi:MAG TPA: polyprenyl synthetase family protein [Polyangiaceae bacterium]|nr:polyprenyl synthetase family protein [Polyangiaceae bacterium]